MSPLLARMNRVWRGAMTGVCFALFGAVSHLVQPAADSYQEQTPSPPSGAAQHCRQLPPLFGGGQSRRRAGLPH